MAETRGQQISRVLASIGFTPRRGEDGRFIEYTKDYADINGRIARCTALFHRGALLMSNEQGQLAGFSVTVQAQVDPHPDEIHTRAPVVMRKDMLTVLEQLAGITTPEVAAADVVSVRCGDCNRMTPEFVVAKSGVMVCPKCLPRHIG